MLSYPIYSWNSVVLPSNIPNINSFSTDASSPLPMIYVLPDEKFIQFVKENNYKIVVKVENSQSCYDTKAMIGLVTPSKNIDHVDARPVFYQHTKLWAIVLLASWVEYPSFNGTAVLYGHRNIDGDKVDIPPIVYATPTPLEVMEEFDGNYKIEYNNSCRLSSYQLFIILVIFVLGVGIICYRKKKC